MDRKFLMTSFGYGLIGFILGIYMAASHNHGQMVTHAHIMLLGFVVSFVYAVIYRLWLDGDTGGLGKAQYWAHQVGTIGLLFALFLGYGKFLPMATLEPLLALSSLIVLAGFVSMKILLIKNR